MAAGSNEVRFRELEKSFEAGEITRAEYVQKRDELEATRELARETGAGNADEKAAGDHDGLRANPDPGSVLQVPGNLVLPMRRIEPGSFLMGSTEEEWGGYKDERPQHEVTIAKPFLIATVPVTQALYYLMTGESPSHFRGLEHPVEQVSWQDTQAFLEKLNKAVDGPAFRLPTEAEWEYACRAGTEGRYYHGEEQSGLEQVSWYGDHARAQTHPVGRKAPNPWGLHDMLGNVWEWVEDDWHENYEGAPTDGSAWVEAPRREKKVRRGCGWYCPHDGGTRVADRSGAEPDYRVNDGGFRLVREID